MAQQYRTCARILYSSRPAVRDCASSGRRCGVTEGVRGWKSLTAEREEYGKPLHKPNARMKSSVRSLNSRLPGVKRNWPESIGPRKLTSENLRLKRQAGEAPAAPRR